MIGIKSHRRHLDNGVDLLSVKATKYCTGNGTWFKDPVSELEWTNYTSCLEVQVRLFFSFGLNIWMSSCLPQQLK